MKARRGLLCLLIASSLASGCTSMSPSIATPVVGVTTLALLPTDSGGRDLIVTLSLDNLNETPMVFGSIDFTIRLGAEGFVDGVGGPVTVPALGTASVRTRVSTDNLSSVSRLISYLQGPQSTLPYEAEGRLLLNSRPPRSFRFATSGQAPLVVSAGR